MWQKLYLSLMLKFHFKKKRKFVIIKMVIDRSNQDLDL